MWRTRLGRGVPTESVARPSGRPEPVSRVAAGRRSIAPSRTSSTARAGETGETDPPRDRQRAGRSEGHVTRRGRSVHAEPSLQVRCPTRVMRHRAFFAWRSATRASIAWPGRVTQVFPSVRHPTALLGFPTLRRFAPASGWTRVAPSRRRSAAGFRLRPSCSASLPVRAHVPFAPLVRPD
jgi:hypothetical protein